MPLSKEKKKEYFARMTQMLNTYGKVFVVVVDNVGSQQMNATRKMMRGTAEILMGKNTLMRKIMNDFLEENPGHFYNNIVHKMAGNVGFVFTNSDLPKVRDMILANRIPAPARVGAISPVDVVVPAGPTGCDPGQTNFFQVLQIPTKIVKGQIEITNPVNLIKKGDKVGSSEAALLSKLNIKPFSYGLVIDCVFDHGAIFSPAVLDIDETYLTAKFCEAVSKVAAISLVIGYPTQGEIRAGGEGRAAAQDFAKPIGDVMSKTFAALALAGAALFGAAAPAAAGNYAAKPGIVYHHASTVTTHSGATVTTYKPITTWRPAATTVYVSPVYTTPVVRAPVYTAPVYTTPVYAAPITSAKPTAWLTPKRDWRAPQRHDVRFGHHNWRR